MAEREYPSNTREADVERSTEDIRQDIAKGEENISQTVEQNRRAYPRETGLARICEGLSILGAGGCRRPWLSCLTDVHNTHHSHGANHGFHCRGSSRLTRWPACRSRRPRPDQGDPAGYCHEGCRRLDKECNLDSCGKRWRRASTADSDVVQPSAREWIHKRITKIKS